MAWLKVIILGIVEGVTEFLPISSTGHLIVAERVFSLSDRLDGTFVIFIQIGAVVAVFAYYRADLWTQARHLLDFRNRNTPENQKIWQLWLGVLVAFIPAAAIGLVIEDWMDRVLSTPLVVALGLIVGGVMFIFVERHIEVNTAPAPTKIDEDPLTFQQALIVGCWQVLALIPGMSRSGMSIIGGMLAGCGRSRATQFSFYLALPTLGAATLYKFVTDVALLNRTDVAFLLLGAVISGVVAWIAIDWLLRYVASNNFIPFGYYRIAFGILLLVVIVLR